MCSISLTWQGPEQGKCWKNATFYKLKLEFIFSFVIENMVVLTVKSLLNQNTSTTLVLSACWRMHFVYCQAQSGTMVLSLEHC